MELVHLGYIGPQRVCKGCFKEINRVEVKDYRVVTQSSKTIIEEILTVSDNLGRRIDEYKFFLTDETLRWGKNPKEDIGSLNVKDILFVKKRGNNCFSIHAFPKANLVPAENFVKREEKSMYIQCETNAQRDMWVEELNLVVPFHIEPIQG